MAKHTSSKVSTTNTDAVLAWNDIKVAFGTIPQASLIALAQRGFTHIMGNEVASAATAAKKAGKEFDPSAKRAEKLEAIFQGTLGTRTASGPRAMGIDKVMREVALETLRSTAAAKKVKLPTKAEGINKLIDNYLAKHEAVARAEAERRMEQQASAAELDDDILGDLVAGDEEGEE